MSAATHSAIPNGDSPRSELDEALRRAISFASDPDDAVRHIKRLYGREWMLAQVEPYLDEFYALRARNVMRAEARAAERAIRAGAPETQVAVLLKKYWLPSEDGENGYLDYVRGAELTADMHDRRAAYLERYANSTLRTAAWHRECAERMRAGGWETMGAMPVDQIPPVPEGE